MNRYIKFTAAAVITALLLSGFCGCGEDKEQTASQETSAVSEQEIIELTADEIRTELVGEWGRLDETMHYFYNDGVCIIGGMQGTYKVDDDKSLVLTTASGSETVYDWAKSFTQTDSPNYWYLSDGIITINGNQFTKISDNATPDAAEN